MAVSVTLAFGVPVGWSLTERRSPPAIDKVPVQVQALCVSTIAQVAAVSTPFLRIVKSRCFPDAAAPWVDEVFTVNLVIVIELEICFCAVSVLELELDPVLIGKNVSTDWLLTDDGCAPTTANELAVAGR